VLLGVFAAAWPGWAEAQQGPERDAVSAPAGAGSPAARRVPEALNFANGLFRDRRYDLAAEEYERFLKDAPPGPDADDARFGLANARLFQGRYDQAHRQFEAFLKAAPHHRGAATAWYRLGETAYMLGDLPAARRALETFTAGNPGHRHLDTAWPYLGDVCLRLGDLSPARRAYEHALAAHPRGRLADRARFGLGRVLALQGESDGALKVFAALAEGGDRDWVDKAWFQAGRLQAGAGRFDRAAEALATLERVAPQSPLVAEARLHRAEALIRLDRRAEAEALLVGLQADSSQTLAAQAALALGAAQLDWGRADQALATLDQAARRFPKAPVAAAVRFRAAEAAVRLGRAGEARARFLEAAAADPDDPWADDALLRAARLALEARDAAGARRLAASLPERFPRSPLRAAARLLEARAALAAGQASAAIALLSRSLAEDQPDAPTAAAQRYVLGLAYRGANQPARAAEVLEALARTKSTPLAADAQFLIGQGHIEARRFAEAVPPLEAYLADKPRGEVADYALAHLAQARLALGQADAAAAALDQLAERFPRSQALAPTRLRLAEAASAAQHPERAIPLFELVVSGTDPALGPRARSGLGWALLDAGRPAEAAAAFAALLESAPDDPLAPEAALARGRALEAADQAGPALEAYTRAAARYPKTDPGRYAALARARLLVAARRPDEAAEAFARYVQDAPGPPTPDPAATRDAVLAEWGWALVDARKPADADRVFARLLREFPDSAHAADARFHLAESAAQAHRLAEVEALLAPLVAEGSAAPPRLVGAALYRLGRTRAERGDWPGAARALDRLLAEFPDSPFGREARFWRAEAALRGGDARTAEAGFEALAAAPRVDSDPEGFAVTIRARRLQSLIALERWKDALALAEALRTEVPRGPLAAEVDSARGRALQGLARFDEARAAYNAVITARTGGDLAAAAQFFRGETFFHQKNYHEAKREFLKVDLTYDAPAWQAAALLEAGKVDEQLAQWADAAETYERLQSKFPREPAAAEARTRLEAARRRASGPSSPAGTADGGTPSGRRTAP
jgi:TolA-binding protein